MWLPAHDIWLPDIVCYEETGKRDYNPRLPYLVVHYDGLVRYLEPTEYVTTCHVNISHFPFDEQVGGICLYGLKVNRRVELGVKRGSCLGLGDD